MKRIFIYLLAVITLYSCSSTSNLPEDEVLYTGMKKIVYTDKNKSDAFLTTQAEIDAALACKPNYALLGSPYYRFPLPFRLWIYNSLINTKSTLGKWFLNSFGTEPVLMSNVNPAVRASIAENVLHYHGYFNGSVDYKEVPGKNPKKEKLSYQVSMGHLYTYDTIKYVNYPSTADSLIKLTKAESFLKSGNPFSVSNMESERVRLNNLFRNNGYFYFRSGYLTYVADTVSMPGRVLLNSQPVTNIPLKAKKQWYLGKLRIEMRDKVTDELTDSSMHKFFSVYYKGKHVPLSPRVILRDLKFRRGDLYSQDKYDESMENINASGLYSLTDFTFSPRDTTAVCDTLDMTLNTVFDKPYDGSIEGNFNSKSNDRMGPGIVLGLTKRNAFRGGEKLNLKLNGSYEWQTGKSVKGNSSVINSYEYGGSVSIDYPRLELPWHNRYRFYSIPSTSFSVSADCMNRADYFKMTTVTGAATYKFQTSATSKHEVSPFMLDYEILQNKTARFDSIINANPALYVSMRNQFVPKMKYTYTYTSPSTYKNPIIWESSPKVLSGNRENRIGFHLGTILNPKRWSLYI